VTSSYLDILRLLDDFSFLCDVLGPCETLLCTNQSLSPYSFTGYNLLVKNRTSLGRGGIILLVKEGIKSYIWNDFSIWKEGKVDIFQLILNLITNFFFN